MPKKTVSNSDSKPAKQPTQQRQSTSQQKKIARKAPETPKEETIYRSAREISENEDEREFLWAQLITYAKYDNRKLNKEEKKQIKHELSRLEEHSLTSQNIGIQIENVIKTNNTEFMQDFRRVYFNCTTQLQMEELKCDEIKCVARPDFITRYNIGEIKCEQNFDLKQAAVQAFIAYIILEPSRRQNIQKLIIYDIHGNEIHYFNIP